jgi:hypothetical protein
MRSALYYPHTEIKSETLLKRCLMLWDQVNVIVPFNDYVPHYSNPSAREAFELIGNCHSPTKEEKKNTHKLVCDFVKRGLPAPFSYSSIESPNEIYEVYPQKLLPETWELLIKAGLVGEQHPGADYPAPEPTGLSLMSLLADCCGGEAFARITDRSTAYASLAGLLTEQHDQNRKVDEAQLELLPITLEVANVDELPFDKWLDLRKREHSKPDGKDIRKLRHRFLDKLEDQATQLAATRPGLAQEERKRQFKQDMRDDYRDLRDALKLEAKQVLTTKEVLVSALAAVATLGVLSMHAVIPMPDVLSGTGGSVTIGGLLGSKSKFVNARRKVLQEHPMAYFYEAAGGLRL